MCKSWKVVIHAESLSNRDPRLFVFWYLTDERVQKAAQAAETHGGKKKWA